MLFNTSVILWRLLAGGLEDHQRFNMSWMSTAGCQLVRTTDSSWLNAFKMGRLSEASSSFSYLPHPPVSSTI